MDILALVACTSRVGKLKEHLPFCREFNILCIEDRVAVDHVFNFENEAALKDSAFWWVVANKFDLFGFAYGLVYPILVGGLWSNGLGQKRETDEEHDEGCVEEGFSWLRSNLIEMVSKARKLD